jgi:hypothetical protein
MSRITALLLSLALLLPAARAQPAEAPVEAPPPTTSPSPPVTPFPATDARLWALDPRSPWEYFKLGEEVAAVAADVQNHTLARTLFVLAYETAKSAPQESKVGPGGADIRISVCLALAAIASSESERRWLHAIASSLGWNSPLGAEPASGGSPAPADPAALELATAMGLIRIGDGRRAARLLDKPEVSRLLEHTEKLLSPAGLSGGAARIRRLMAEWPICAECKNRRFIKSQDGVRICPTCAGKPGPKLPQQELLYQLRLESTLLHGVQRSWVAQAVVDGGAPLRDLDPDELAATYRVEPSKTLWRAGTWTAPAGETSGVTSSDSNPESGR